MPILDESIENACLHIRRQTSNEIFEQFNGAQYDKKQQFEIIRGIKGVEYIEQFIKKNPNKDLHYGLDYKNRGNQEFKQCRWDAALDLYNKSVICMPGKTSDMATVLGNRSAVLYILKEYELAVNDIDTALPLFPKENLFKLVHRKAKCLLELERQTDALIAFQQSELLIQTNEKIPSTQKMTLMSEIKSLSKYLRRNCNPFVNHNVVDDDDMTNENDVQPNGFHVNNSVEIAYNKLEGRHAICCNKINAGEIILRERSYASALSKAFNFTHCQNCMQRSSAPVSCDSCRDIIFCSQLCKDQADFHKYECGILGSIWKCKSDLATHLSIRMITTKDPASLIKFGAKHEHNENVIDNGSLSETIDEKDYKTVYSLLMHETEFSREKLFEFMLMAKFQLECLKTGGYLANNNEYDSFFGSLLYRNILILHFNAHEIFELQKDNDKDLGKTVCIAAAIYPFLAQFNHSCDPTTVRYFEGTRVVIRATRNIAVGEQISENYGPIFTQEPEHERRLQLKEKYKFECQCEACTNHWPLLKEMHDSRLPIKCRGNNGTYCGTILTCNELTTKICCSACKHETDVMEIIKFLKTVEVNLDTGRHLFESNQISDALEIYLQLIKDMDEYIKPPFSKWHVCQKRIRSAYLEYGNKVNFKLAPNNTDTDYFM